MSTDRDASDGIKLSDIEALATRKPCETCGESGRVETAVTIGGRTKTSQCPTCRGSGRAPLVDREAVLAALGYEQVGPCWRLNAEANGGEPGGWVLGRTLARDEYVDVGTALVAVSQEENTDG